MAMVHEIRKLLDAPIEDVLLKLYPVSLFRWLYDVTLRHLAENSPAALPQPDRPRGADKIPKKAYLIQLLLAVLRDQAMGRQFFESLPPATRSAIAALTWGRREDLAALEKALGQQIAELNPNERRRYWEPFLLPPEHGFLVVVQSTEHYWSYSEREKPSRDKYSLLLPDAIRTVFKAFVPPPPGYDLLPLDHGPTPAHHRYSCAEKLVTDFGLVAEYIAQGQLKFTKAERVAAPSIKVLAQITGGPEFFPESDDNDLTLLRITMLADGLALVSAKDREKLLTRPGSTEGVREVIRTVVTNASLLHKELLPHLSPSRNRWCQYNSRAVRELVAFFEKLPGEKWVSWENVRSYHVLMEVTPSLFDGRTTGLQVNALKLGDRWSTMIHTNAANAFDLISEPLLKGAAFLLAAFGVVEIAYLPPTHPHYCRPRKAYLTPFDGLAFVRLTLLGEFVFGRRDNYEVASGPPAKSPIVLDDARLLATCRNPDQLTELALGQFMETLAPGRYRMTAASFLGGCGSRENIEERIQLFRRLISAAPPANWELFFERILARVAPLTLETEYVVLKLSGDAEIRRLLAADPLLREIILKVEGLRIAVRQSDLKKLSKRLEQFGYLSPMSRRSS